MSFIQYNLSEDWGWYVDIENSPPILNKKDCYNTTIRKMRENNKNEYGMVYYLDDYYIKNILKCFSIILLSMIIMRIIN